MGGKGSLHMVAYALAWATPSLRSLRMERHGSFWGCQRTQAQPPDRNMRVTSLQLQPSTGA